MWSRRVAHDVGRAGGRSARARYRRVAGALQRKALTALAGLSAGFVRRTGCPVDLTFWRMGKWHLIS